MCVGLLNNISYPIIIQFTAPCIQYYISGWKMFYKNRIILEVPLASVTLALDVYSKQQK